jgi:hypothetical protein
MELDLGTHIVEIAADHIITADNLMPLGKKSIREIAA